MNLDEPLLGKSWFLWQLETSVHSTAGKLIYRVQSEEVPLGFLVVLSFEILHEDLRVGLLLDAAGGRHGPVFFLFTLLDFSRPKRQLLSWLKWNP